MATATLAEDKECGNGGITQLVECLLCKQKVAGSNPVTSTMLYIYVDDKYIDDNASSREVLGAVIQGWIDNTDVNQKLVFEIRD